MFIKVVSSLKVVKKERKKILSLSSQVKSKFIVIMLHVWTYSGTKCRVSQDHGATYQLNIR